MERPTAAGRLLAARHATTVAEPESVGSLLNYGESPREGDWTLRSALVRLAQPEPGRVAAVLELVRRLDAVLHPLVRSLERATVVCDRALTFDSLVRAGDGWELLEPTSPYPDVRLSDLARLGRSDPSSFDAVIDAYVEIAQLTPDEQAALPLLGVALELDALADVLVGWAQVAPGDPPVEAVDEACRLIFAQLDQLAVPFEQGPPPRGRGRGV